MTTHDIKTDAAVVSATTADVRGIAERVSAASDAAAASVAAAAALPVPAGARPSPAMAAVAEATEAMAVALRAEQRRLIDAADAAITWEGDLGQIQQDGAVGVSSADGGGGGSW